MTVTSATEAVGEPVHAGDALYNEVLQFLWNEAELLDDDRYEEWFALLDPEIRYRMPVRVTRYRRDGKGFAEHMAHFDENLTTIRIRIDRVLKTDVAFAEDPPSRALRFVTNVRVARLGEDLRVRSYVLLVRNRWDIEHYEFLAAERHDLLRPTSQGLRIAARDIHVQQSRMGVTNVALFL